MTHVDRSFLVVSYGVSLVLCTAILAPVYYLVVSAFKDNAQIFGSPLSLPVTWDPANFWLANQYADLTHAFGISFGVILAAELGTLILAFPAAFVIGRSRGRSGTVLLGAFGIGFLIPSIVILVPVAVVAARLGILGQPITLIVVSVAMRIPLSVLVLASYVRSVPIDIAESAQIDGAGRARVLWHIYVPLTQPGLFTVVILNFLSMWNEYLFALVLLTGENRTIQVAVPTLQSVHSTDYGLVAAGVLISLAPVFLIYALFQERIIGGLATTGSR